MNIRSKVTMLLSLLFLASLFNAYFIFQLEKDGNEKLAWVSHTNQVLFASERLLGSIRDAETGQRGYLLTQNLNYLEPYYQAVDKVSVIHANLLELTQDNPEQQTLLMDMEINIQLKMAELKETIDFTNSGRLMEALEIVTMDRGKQYMDAIRADIHQFISHELVLLEKRKGVYNSSRERIKTLIAVELVLFVILAVFTSIFVRNSLFSPLSRLVASVKRLERGEKISHDDMLPDDEIGLLSKTFVMMSEKVHQREEMLSKKAHYDELTGLKNRAALVADLAAAMNNAEHNPFALLFLDLNKLKQLNDTSGHQAGDLMLRETANRLLAGVRQTDSVYRYGGDEFVILLGSTATKDDVEAALVTIHAQLKPLAKIQGSLVTISLSIGVAFAPKDTNQDKELIRFADIAMYHAKSSPTQGYCFFSPSMLSPLAPSPKAYNERA